MQWDSDNWDSAKWGMNPLELLIVGLIDIGPTKYKLPPYRVHHRGLSVYVAVNNEDDGTAISL